MPSIDVVTVKNKKKAQVDLPEAVFAGPVNRPLLHEAVTLWLRGQRAGTSATKGRSEVSGGGRKPWKQKGTGRARSGSSRSPVWVGGGTIFGPVPRDYAVKFPRQKSRLALQSALKLHLSEGTLLVLEGFEPAEPKTKEIHTLLKDLGLAGKKVLMVAPAIDEKMARAARNHADLMVVVPEALNPYLVTYHNVVVIFKDALTRIEEVFGR
jgi:large subunit ribosomal protein L4